MTSEYRLGIDVGTTFSAAAVVHGGVVETVDFGHRQFTVPSMIFAAGDRLAFGSEAATEGCAEPTGLAREFKRRLGDPVPMILSGRPYHADRLVALMVRWIVDTVAEQRRAAPRGIVLTHPANWTPYQLELLEHALDDVDLERVGLVSEPVAAAIDFSSASAVAPGQLVMVYDLGGGTFDMALLRKTSDGFDQTGVAGIDRLGGIDFDEAVFRFVLGATSETAVNTMRDTQARAAFEQLRQSCVDAKEALSSNAAAEIEVAVNNQVSQVRITRGEFEEMIRPMLGQTIDLVSKNLRTSSTEPASLAAVLLVGGSSRIPFVSQLISQMLHLPVRVDAHPKLVVARGAARYAAAMSTRASTPGRSRTESGTRRGESRGRVPPSRRGSSGTPQQDRHADKAVQHRGRLRQIAVAAAAMAAVCGSVAAGAIASSPTRGDDARATSTSRPQRATTATPSPPALHPAPTSAPTSAVTNPTTPTTVPTTTAPPTTTPVPTATTALPPTTSVPAPTSTPPPTSSAPPSTVTTIPAATTEPPTTVADPPDTSTTLVDDPSETGPVTESTQAQPPTPADLLLAAVADEPVSNCYADDRHADGGATAVGNTLAKVSCSSGYAAFGAVVYTLFTSPEAAIEWVTASAWSSGCPLYEYNTYHRVSCETMWLPTVSHFVVVTGSNVGLEVDTIGSNELAVNDLAVVAVVPSS